MHILLSNDKKIFWGQLKLALISGTAVKGFIYTILEED
jgi:hypothetical protein